MTNDNIKLREMHMNDAVSLQILFDSCQDYAIFSDGQPFKSDAAITEFGNIPHGFEVEKKRVMGIFDVCNYLVGVLEGLAGYPDNETWFLGLMLIKPSHRSSGIGSSAFINLEAYVADESYKSIELAVIKDNIRGLEFWKKIGFKIIKELPFEKFGNKYHKRYLMRKSLTLQD